MTTSIEDQQKFAVPLNRDTEKIFYKDGDKNLRMIIDGKVLTEPRIWKVTKINRISPNGIARVTLAQDMFNEHTDYIELDDNGNVIGMWADYYSSAILPIPSDKPIITNKVYSKITFSGVKPEIKIGGNYKKYTVNFYEMENEEVPFKEGTWSFTIDGEDVSSLVNTLQSDKSTDVLENQIKVKFVGDYDYIGKVLQITYKSNDGIISHLDVEIVSL